MKKKHLLLGLLIVALSFYYAFNNVSYEQLVAALGSVQYIYMLPAAFMILLTFVFRAMRWRYLVRSVKDVKTSNLISPLIVGFMANILPARAGELIRAYLLSKKESISFSASFATIFVERLMDMLVIFMLLIWVIFFNSDVFSQGDSGSNHRLMGYMIKFGWISFIAFVGIFSFSALLQYKNDWAMRIVVFFTKPLPEKWKIKIVKMVISFTDGLRILKDMRGFVSALILSCFVWSGIVLTYYPILLAFGLGAMLPMITACLIINLTVCIFISLFPTPGFLGSYQAACVVALHEIFGISKAVSASYGIVAWLIGMGLTMLTGLIFVLKDNISLSDLSTVNKKGNILQSKEK